MHLQAYTPHSRYKLPWKSGGLLCAVCAARRTFYSTRHDKTQPARSISAKPDTSNDSGNVPGSEPSHNPKPLSRPLGVSAPPRTGENSGIDTRTFRQRRDDFFNYDKHLERRKELKTKLAKPYFRDWTSMRHHKGKSFLAPKTLIKPASALYFPNLRGSTLVSRKPEDTTSRLSGRSSIVALFSSTWAEQQTNSFVAEKANPALHEVLGQSKDNTSVVSLNIEPSSFKAMLVRLFSSTLRRTIPQYRWDKYFLIQKGFEEELMAALGVANSKVGYVYLVDSLCRVRWAGSGDAEGGEKDALVKGLKRMIAEERETVLDEKSGDARAEGERHQLASA